MGTLAFDCPHCSATKSTFSFLDNMRNLIEMSKDVRTKEVKYKADSIGYCGHCKRAVLFELHFNGIDSLSPNEIHGNIVDRGWAVGKSYPPAPSLEVPKHTPPQVANPLRDALKSQKSGIWSGAGMLARKAVEMALAYKKNTREIPNLKQAIKELRESGDVPEYVAEWGDHVRALGNSAGHRDDFEESEAREAIEFAEELVKTLFTRPKDIELARQRYESKNALKAN